MTGTRKTYVITNLYVGNLAAETTEHHLRNLFGTFGAVARVTLALDRDGRSHGFAFVEMPNSSEARSARELLNKTLLNNREIQISEARPLAEVMGRA